MAGRFGEAQSSLSVAAQSLRDHFGTWLALAWAQLLGEQPEAALRTFQHSVLLDRNFAESHGSVAVVQANLERVEEA